MKTARLLAGLLLVCGACSDPAKDEPGLAIKFSSVSLSHFHACALDTDHRAWCWGLNDWGQLGVSIPSCDPLSCPESPALVQTDLRFAQISAGGVFSCGLTSGGAAYCWGVDSQDELGAVTKPTGCGTSTCSIIPLPVTGNFTFKQIASGAGVTCGVTSTGVGRCWGTTNVPGTHSNPHTATPVSLVFGVSGDSAWDSIAAFCGMSAAHGLACWGSNDHGQMGIGAALFQDSTFAPRVVSSPTPLHGVTVGAELVCALDATGAAYCWGFSTSGSLGVGSGGIPCNGTFATGTCFTSPLPVISAFRFTSLSAADYHVCGLTAAGDAYCWGRNDAAQTGVGGAGLPISSVANPTLVQGGHHFATLGAGGSTTCGITPQGEMWCWGSNAWGQLGVSPLMSGYSFAPVRLVPVISPE